MKRKFTVVIERKGDQYVARCAGMPDVEGRGRDKNEALEKIRAAIIKKLEGGSDAGWRQSPIPFPHRLADPSS